MHVESLSEVISDECRLVSIVIKSLFVVVVVVVMVMVVVVVVVVVVVADRGREVVGCI